MRLISWNLNGRTNRIAEQVAALAARSPDVVALQEVTTRSGPALAAALAEVGMPHAVDSFALAPADFVPGGPRRYGQLLASCHPLEPISPGRFAVAWPERILSARVLLVNGPVEVHTTHIPPGSSNGWIKVEMLERLFAGLACPSIVPRILCGDFNTPQMEHPDGEAVTWAQHIRTDGKATVRTTVRGGPGIRWDAAERGILLGLAAHDLRDVFRALHGYETEAFSWVMRRGALTAFRRYDHIFASASLRPITCAYLHDVREQGLSDHAAIEACFDLPEQAGSSAES